MLVNYKSVICTELILVSRPAVILQLADIMLVRSCHYFPQFLSCRTSLLFVGYQIINRTTAYLCVWTTCPGTNETVFKSCWSIAWDPLGNHAPPVGIPPTIWYPSIWGCMRQEETQLRASLSGGCRPCIALHIHKGVRAYVGTGRRDNRCVFIKLLWKFPVCLLFLYFLYFCKAPITSYIFAHFLYFPGSWCPRRHFRLSINSIE